MGGSINYPPTMNGVLKNIKTRVKALEIGTPRLYSEVLAEEEVTLDSPTDFGGPSVTIQLPENAFVTVYAQLDIKSTSGLSYVTLGEENGDFDDSIIMESSSNTYTTAGTAPGPLGLNTLPRVGPLTFPASKGTRTYTMKYEVGIAGSTTCLVKNRKLWVWTLG